MWAMARSVVRSEIQEAQDIAVKAALSLLQDEGIFVRTGKQGVNFHTADIAVALFEHGTSRALDPQLHTHALLMNLGIMEDGRPRALVQPEIFKLKMLLGAAYRTELAAQLEDRLGVVIERDLVNGFSFVVRGVSETLCEFFSKRRAEIEKIVGAEGLESAKAAEIAAKESREVKDVVPPRRELFKQWIEIGAQFLFGAEQVHEILGKAPSRQRGDEFDQALQEAISKMETTESHFTRHALLQQVFEASVDRGLNVATIRQRFDAAIEKGERLIHLGKGKTHEARYTTRAIRDAEESMLAGVDALAETKSHGVGLNLRRDVLEKYASPRSAILEELRYHSKGILKAAVGRSQDKIDRNATKSASKFVISAEQKPRFDI